MPPLPGSSSSPSYGGSVSGVIGQGPGGFGARGTVSIPVTPVVAQSGMPINRAIAPYKSAVPGQIAADCTCCGGGQIGSGRPPGDLSFVPGPVQTAPVTQSNTPINTTSGGNGSGTFSGMIANTASNPILLDYTNPCRF